MPDSAQSISEEALDAIARLTDPILRNLRITQAYHELASAFARRTGSGANWCTFATWASRQAGQSIRGEDVLRALEQTLRLHPEVVSRINRVWRSALLAALEKPGTRRARLAKTLGADAFARAGDAVARGNLKVFDEIGRLFARFIPLCENGPVAPEALSGFLAGLRPGPAPDGQDGLRAAFQGYCRALSTADPREKAEWMLLANIQIGLHEQTRLQPEILEALEVPSSTVAGLGKRLLPILFPSTTRWFGALRAPFAVLIGGVGKLGESALRALLREAITDTLMTLTLGDETIRLGSDLRGEAPELLREPALAELLAILTDYRPGPRERDAYGADDWSNLRERMVLIARLFHLRHADDRLFWPPFTEDQVRAMVDGRMPTGRL